MWSQWLPWGGSCTDIFCLTQSFKWLTLFFPILSCIFHSVSTLWNMESFILCFPCSVLTQLWSYGTAAVSSETQHHLQELKTWQSIAQNPQICFNHLCQQAPQSQESFRTFQHNITIRWMLQYIPVWWKINQFLAQYISLSPVGCNASTVQSSIWTLIEQ